MTCTAEFFLIGPNYLADLAEIINQELATVYLRKLIKVPLKHTGTVSHTTHCVIAGTNISIFYADHTGKTQNDKKKPKSMPEN
jgi:hypothetical protein